MNPIDRLIDLALTEDIANGDITSEYLIPAASSATAQLTAKEEMVIAGLDMVTRVFHRLDPEIEIRFMVKEGEVIPKGTVIASLSGKTKTLLTGERTALNFLQRLSGIATHTRNYVRLMEGTTTKLVDTRKTTPGWRQLEKYAVRMGGAYNHRMGLYDGILIKDNHIDASGGILPAVQKAREQRSPFIKIEVETRNMAEVKEALESNADIIMLDNMTPSDIQKAIALIDKKALVEISGGVTKENLRELASLGADFISSGALTHAARSVDISMTLSV